MKQLIYFFAVLFLLSCHTSTPIVINAPDIDNELLDTLVVRAEKIDRFSRQMGYTTYRATPKRTLDLLHTDLEIQLDWKNRAVNGKAVLEMRPYFYPVDSVTLDAVHFDIHSIMLENQDEKITRNKNHYTYDTKKLKVDLGRSYSKNETFCLKIDYTAYPETGSQSQAFSIGSDQGLFFIDPDQTHPGKPTQVWTQGETQYNSRWFPTFDQPNERCTQSLSVTVPDSMITLSNGTLISQQSDGNGNRTDHWQLDLPHTPYLFALVVGDYVKQQDSWNDIELGYYVYPEYRDIASQIYNHTPEMLDFFSSLTGITYPWPKYSQIVVSDFVSGAMENTTAVIFSEGFQKSREDLVDFPNDMIVAHEMAHHWFGNLVTCESWANLTLNEGFANYAEYLWQDHKYGKDQAELYRYSEEQQYLMSARNQTHPLIDFEYAHRDGMFDAHSYNKGSAILHMLRLYLGDPAFFEGINQYLEKHAFDSAEAHDLRLAFEKVCGEDLNWFFDQWFFDKGHPEIEANYQLIDSTQLIIIDLTQVQDSQYHRPVFQFPLDIQLVYSDGIKQNKTYWINQKEKQIRVPFAKKPEIVLIDPYKKLLGEIRIDYSADEWAFIYRHSDHIVNQYLALNEVKRENKYLPMIIGALEHNNWKIRSVAIQNLPYTIDDPLLARLTKLLKEDPSSLIRSRAMRKLNQASALTETMILDRLEQDSSASVLSYALDFLDNERHPDAEKYANRYLDNQSKSIGVIVASILSKTGKKEYLDYFESRLFEGRIFFNSYLLNNYSGLLREQSDELIVEKCQWLHQQTQYLPDYQRRFYLKVIQDQMEYLINKSDSLAESKKYFDRIQEKINILRKLLEDQ